MANRKCGDVRDDREDITCKTLWLNPAETVLNLHLPGFILPRGCHPFQESLPGKQRLAVQQKQSLSLIIQML